MVADQRERFGDEVGKRHGALVAFAAGAHADRASRLFLVAEDEDVGRLLVGEVRGALSVVKRRSGPHERSIRQLLISNGTISIGPPLKDFTGVLTGTPTFLGGQPLL